MVLDDTPLNTLLKELTERRSVRAIAKVGSFGTPLQWAGSLPQLLVVDRKVQSPAQEIKNGVVLHQFPYEALEQGSFPTGLLAEARMEYDPTRLLTKQQKNLPTPDHKQLVKKGQERLKKIHLNKQADFIEALLVSREVFLDHVIPQVLPPEQMFCSDLRFPEHLQNRLSLSAPQVLSALEELFALRHPEEAPGLLAATRGLSLTQQEKRARAAVESGYLRGSMFYLRQQSTRIHREALKQWNHLPAARIERLNQLWGLERSPLGWVAVHLVQEFL